jgi:hypothetical protein
MSRRICLGAAALFLGGLLVCSVQAAGRPRGRAINEFLVPRSDEVTTNLNQLTSKKDGLKQLEEDLYSPLQSFAPKSSLDGVVARPPRPPAGPVIQNKRVKELLDRRKDWVFMTPEDLLAAPTIDEILKTPQFGPDGQERKDLSAIERYYQRLAAKRPGVNQQIQSDNDNLFGPPTESKPGQESGGHNDLNLPSSLRESAEALNRLFAPGSNDSPFAREAKHGNLSDIFGLGDNTLPQRQAQERKKLMDEYHSLVDPSWHPAPVATQGNPLAILADAVSPAGRPAASSPGAGNLAARSALEVQLDVTYPRLGPPELPDVNARALGQTRPTPPLPKVEPTRIPPAAPTFTAPKRSFR